MKKHATIAITAAALVLAMAAACSGGESQLKKCAQGYLEAMGNYRPAEAKPYASQETCEQTLAFYEMLMEHTDSAVYRNNMPAEITLGAITYPTDTTAEVAFHKSTPATQQDGTLHLLKREGRWMVHEVIEVPPIFKLMNQGPRTFSDEELEEIRKNGPTPIDSLRIR